MRSASTLFRQIKAVIQGRSQRDSMPRANTQKLETHPAQNWVLTICWNVLYNVTGHINCRIRDRPPKRCTRKCAQPSILHLIQLDSKSWRVA